MRKYILEYKNTNILIVFFGNNLQTHVHTTQRNL